MRASLTTYHGKRRLVQVISTIAIVALPFLNILRLDIRTLRFYFLNSVLWVDEFYILFLVVMLILWVIVMFSMLYGRIWCGWMCPQTVLSELVRWFEGKTHRWLRVPKQGGAVWRRVASYGLVAIAAAAVSLLIGFNLVAYFVDPYRLMREIASWTVGPVTAWIIIGIAGVMLVDIMFWREKFCAKACPYGMMQMLVTDRKTQIVRYRTEQGDECIECKACLRVCSMGIDIRESPYQSECIQCGECVDACAQILARVNKPTLINFSWGDKADKKSGSWYERLGFVDAKRWIMLAFTLVYTFGIMALIEVRQPLSLSVSGDRSTLYRRGDDGRIYNDYQLKVSNRSMNDGVFVFRCSDVPKASDCLLHLGENPVRLKSREVRMVKFSISTNGSDLLPGPNRLGMSASSVNDSTVSTNTDVVFFMPEQHM